MKPIVHYKRMTAFPPKVGESALVNALDHPYHPVDEEFGEKILRTSVVISVEENGDFTTRNTKYVLVG